MKQSILLFSLLSACVASEKQDTVAGKSALAEKQLCALSVSLLGFSEGYPLLELGVTNLSEHPILFYRWFESEVLGELDGPPDTVLRIAYRTLDGKPLEVPRVSSEYFALWDPAPPNPNALVRIEPRATYLAELLLTEEFGWSRNLPETLRAEFTLASDAAREARKLEWFATLSSDLRALEFCDSASAEVELDVRRFRTELGPLPPEPMDEPAACVTSGMGDSGVWGSLLGCTLGPDPTCRALVERARRGGASPCRALAEVIYEEWAGKTEMEVLIRPRQVWIVLPTVEEVSLKFPLIKETTIIHLRGIVGVDGEVTAPELLRRSASGELDKVILDAFLSALYRPARSSQGLVAEQVDFVYRLDVH